MHIHILGICGTFMGGLAQLARAAGHRVTGADENVYPPMSTLLEEQGIDIVSGYDPEQLKLNPDLIVVGNVMSRGRPIIEAMLNQGLAYTSGPQWLGEHLLNQRWVLAAAGTHGKTTTSSMMAWILEAAGMNPGFLIGGVPANFGVSARLGDAPFFVIEADEYDTAFFDKRSKFVHYHPRTAVLNNLEYDHADIFPDIAAIQRQFHHLVRTVPGNGLIVANGVANGKQPHLQAALDIGSWTPIETVGDAEGWQASYLQADGSEFDVSFAGAVQGRVQWSLLGDHNVENALSAIAAARHSGVPAAQAIESLAEFESVKRRMEVRGSVNGVTVIDDFAHHPTAIRLTLEGLRASLEGRETKGRILAVLEPRSNTMRLGVHQQTLADSLVEADHVYIYQPEGLDWDLQAVAQSNQQTIQVVDDLQKLVSRVAQESRPGDQVLVMSNGGFGGIHQKLLDAL